ncbi:hypothetical protein [Flavicella sp.]|uniref:hypothetical protein n=1 Tax=Flavicella sp. TaxID=2957742 RepID=UPI00260AB2D2|nr:hypothetical protein [Flavicella sp.]MDG1805938.1 hypothetical protein [Flavicella sp.]
MKKIATIFLMMIGLCNLYSQELVPNEYNTNPIYWNNLKLETTNYTKSYLTEQLQLDNAKIEYRVKHDEEWYDGDIVTLRYYPEGNVDNEWVGDFDLNISFKKDHYSLYGKVYVPGFEIKMMGHVFKIGETTREQVDGWLNNGKIVSENDKVYIYTFYTHLGYTTVSFLKATNRLFGFDCDCQ